MERFGWYRLAAGGPAVVALCAPIFPALVAEWAQFPSLSHGFAVPVIAAYLVWTRREALRALTPTPAWAGLPVLAAGLALYVVGTRGGEPFLARLSLLVTLGGTALFLAGTAATKVMLPGIGYLFFMIPLPYVTLRGLIDQTRLVDATLAATALPWLGVPVYRQGFLLHIPTFTFEVAPVCSSVPAIASLMALGAAYGYVNRRPRPVCIALILAAPPLGVASNVVRITLTAAGAHYLGPIAVNNVIHAWNGTMVFLMTLGALVMLDAGLERLARRRR